MCLILTFALSVHNKTPMGPIHARLAPAGVEQLIPHAKVAQAATKIRFSPRSRRVTSRMQKH